MARYSNPMHRADGNGFPVREDHPGLPGRRNFDRAGRACATQQGTIPCRNAAQGETEYCQCDSGQTCHCCQEAKGGSSMEDQHRSRVGPGGRQFQPPGAEVAQIRLKRTLPLVPPKPNELDSAVRIDILRATFGT